jgi:putative protease
VAQIKKRKKRAYITLNAVLNNADLKPIGGFIRALRSWGADAVIVSDPGLLPLLKRAGLPAHLSTQANVLNRASALFWKRAGVRRIILARELPLADVRAICAAVPMAFEVFIHGALCISYSGRCLLSDYLAARPGNKGRCAHVCRWGFSLFEQRKGGPYFPVEERAGRTYLYNSKDLWTITLFKDIMASGVRALKIEGRNKGVHYLSVVTRVYREAMDAYGRPGGRFRIKKAWVDDLLSVSNRGYTTGFYRDLGYRGGRQQYGRKGYFRESVLVGIVKETLPDNRAVVDIRNDFHAVTPVSLFSPERGTYLRDSRLRAMTDVSGRPLKTVHTNRVVIMQFEKKVSNASLVRVRGRA